MKDLLPVSVPVQKISVLIITVFFLSFSSKSQNIRQVNHQTQTWVSVNTTARVSSKFSVIADVHMRRNHFVEKTSFLFVRTALQYHVDNNLSVAAGYGHMWLYPSTAGWRTVSNEHRIYQQAILLSKFHKVSIMQRFRNEQRWQQKIAADKFTGGYRFTNRFRYLLSFTIPVFKDNNLPALCISDEIALQAGREVVANPFDQNRLFAGIKQKISKSLSFDAGYMIVYQQKSSGLQYDLNNTYRLFFYYAPTLYKKHHG